MLINWVDHPTAKKIGCEGNVADLKRQNRFSLMSVTFVRNGKFT